MPASKPPVKRAPLAPVVLAALQQAVINLGTQTAVAADLGVSVAAVNQLLKGRYAGDVAGMAERIRGRYMAATVVCPVMGTLGRDSCLDYQRAKPAHTNPMRARLSKACLTCPNRRSK